MNLFRISAVAVSLLLCSKTAIAQSPTSGPMPLAPVTSGQVNGSRPAVVVHTPLVWNVSQSSAANSRAPVLIGAAAGAVVGAFVGNAVGGPRLCPNSPNIGCPQPRIGTLSGAALGALVGGIAGYFFARQSKE